MATQPGSTGEPIEPLTYKTWVLKVSIHCEGCKRKVNKVLHSVEGVYTVNIDTKLQKVVVNGNVDYMTLIKKLEKSGKHAELWPEIVEKKKKKKKRKSKKKEKQNNPESSSDGEEEGEGGEEGRGGSSEKDKPAANVEVVQDSAKVVDFGVSPSKPSASGGGGGAGSFSVKFAEAVAKSLAGSGGGQGAAESKSEGKKPETGSPGSQSPAADKKAGESEGVAAGQSGGGKKKKKKGHKSPAEGEPSNVGAPAPTGLAHHHAGPTPVNSPPRHPGYQYPTHIYAPPQSVHAVSYNTAYPTSSYTASYYAAQPPPSHAYMHSGPYVHYGPEAESPPSDADSYPRQPLDSFELLSDENPNGCSVM